MTKEELRKAVKHYREMIKTSEKKYKPFWERQLKKVSKKLYG